jgi:hypothetical protein
MSGHLQTGPFAESAKESGCLCVNFTALELAGALSVSVNHDASLIVNANYSVMRPAVELRKLNRVGDRVCLGKPQATKPQRVADEITTPGVHARADLINGYFFFFWPRSYESISGRDGEHTVHSIDSAFDSGRNAATLSQLWRGWSAFSGRTTTKDAFSRRFRAHGDHCERNPPLRRCLTVRRRVVRLAAEEFLFALR